MSTKKLTKRDLYLMLFDVVADGDSPDKEMLCDFVSHEISLLDKKRNAKKAPTPAQLENAATKTAILGVLAVHTEGLRATDLANAMNLSVQKVSALLRQLVIAGSVERVEDKKVVTFVLKG
jgi:predicted Rossmann fold nucleotide-binding protein DprA/Smf involved in DNA uptake